MAAAAMTKTRHPHEHTLALLQLAIDKVPPLFPEEERRRFQQRCDAFKAAPATPYEDISALIAEIGKASWAERRAYEDMYERYGRASEEAHLLEHLDAGIREKYERYIHEGGKIAYIERVRTEAELLQPSRFETYFSPEEKFAIEQALLTARERAAKEIDGLVTDAKRAEFESLVARFHEEEHRIDTMLAELRGLADVSQKWKPAILDRVRTLREGWSVVEQGLSEERLARELEYWQGTLESFLHA